MIQYKQGHPQPPWMQPACDELDHSIGCMHLSCYNSKHMLQRVQEQFLFCCQDLVEHLFFVAAPCAQSLDGSRRSCSAVYIVCQVVVCLQSQTEVQHYLSSSKGNGNRSKARKNLPHGERRSWSWHSLVDFWMHETHLYSPSDLRRHQDPGAPPYSAGPRPPDLATQPSSAQGCTSLCVSDEKCARLGPSFQSCCPAMSTVWMSAGSSSKAAKVWILAGGSRLRMPCAIRECSYIWLGALYVCTMSINPWSLGKRQCFLPQVQCLAQLFVAGDYRALSDAYHMR
jgi:hypothetical protein